MVSCSKKINLDNIDIKINNDSVIRVNNIKFLGVILDENLTWKLHLNQLCVRVSQITGIIHKTRDNLNNESLKLIYNSTVYPLLLYCSAIWGGTLKC